MGSDAQITPNAKLEALREAGAESATDTLAVGDRVKYWPARGEVVEAVVREVIPHPMFGTLVRISTATIASIVVVRERVFVGRKRRG